MMCQEARGGAGVRRRTVTCSGTLVRTFWRLRKEAACEAGERGGSGGGIVGKAEEEWRPCGSPACSGCRNQLRDTAKDQVVQGVDRDTV